MTIKSGIKILMVVVLLAGSLLGIFNSPIQPAQAQVNIEQPSFLSNGTLSDPDHPIFPTVPSANITVVRHTTSKSLRQSDFAPILETSLFSEDDYSVYAWVHFNTGASSRTIQIRWRYTQPDGKSFDVDSPWWNFGSQGMVANYLQIYGASQQMGKWEVRFYAQASDGGGWQNLGMNTFYISKSLGCTTLSTNGGFENGSNGWVKSSNTFIGTGKPHWGSQGAQMGQSDNQTYTLYQEISLPNANPGELTMAFYYNIYTQDSSSYPYDYFYVQIRDTNNNLLETLDTMTNQTYYSRNPLDSWFPQTWDISKYAGQTIRVYEYATNDVSYPTTWYLDDYLVKKCATSTIFKTQVILAEPKDETHDSKHDKAYYQKILVDLQSYMIENSMGTILLQPDQIYDGWYKLDKTHKEYAADSMVFVNDAETKALGTTDVPLDTIMFVVFAGKASQEFAQGSSDAKEHMSNATWSGNDMNEITVSEHRILGGWAHEAGHVIGNLTKGFGTADLYNMGNVDEWDLMARGSWNGNPGGSSPPHMSSFTKEFLGWVNYQTVNKGNNFWIDLLPLKQVNAPVYRYVAELRSDNITPEKYYVIETRNKEKKYSDWDISVPKTGMILYYVDTKGKNNTSWDDMKVQVINVPDVLDPPGLLKDTTYDDWDHMVRFKVIEEQATSTSYNLRLELSDPVSLTTWAAGVILKIKGVVNSAIAPINPINETPLYPEFRPDLDLHVYLNDGRHVGLNYITGEYELQIPGVETSGNLANSHEWILLPQGVTGYRFVVRNASTGKYLELNPEALTKTDGIETYTIEGFASDPANGFYKTTLTQHTIDDFENHELPVTFGSWPTPVSVGAPAPISIPFDLTTSGSAPFLVDEGHPLTYTLILGNAGGSLASGVQLVATIDQNVDFVSAPGFVPAGGNNYTYAVSSMDMLDREFLSFTVNVKPGLTIGMPIVFNLSIQDDGTQGADGVPTNNQASVTSYVSGYVYIPIIRKDN